MIEKIIKISGTGKFYDYRPEIVPSDVRTINFQKINLLYGENGSGKTTLAIIFKSLKGDNNLLQNKRSFDTSIPQSIKILTDISPNRVVEFNNNIWSAHYPNLEVFDIHFINENIHTNLGIENSNRKRMFEVVFGHQGVRLKTEIQDIKGNIQILKEEIRHLENQIREITEHAFEPEDYCQLSIDVEIDSKINLKKRSIETAEKSQEISNKSLLATISLIDIPYNKQKLSSILPKSISSISNTYLELFKTHKKHLNSVMGGEEEAWIKDGYEAIIDNKCPFCQRQFDTTMEILESYHQYFNQEYNTLLQELSILNNSVTRFNLEAKTIQCESAINSNKALIEFWNDHIEGVISLESILGQKDAIITAFNNVKTTLEKKIQKPTESLGAQSIIDFERKLESLNNRIKGFNSDIERYNILIRALKQSNNTNVILLKSELKKLIAIAKRVEPSTQTLCNELQIKKRSLNNEVNRKELKKQELDTHSSMIFRDYGAKMNNYLHDFAPYLKVQNFESGYVTSSREPMVKFGLLVNGNEIKLKNEETNLSFKYTLSEGDKSTLALSFFLAKLEIDGNMEDKVIIFDDPVSSFDSNRKSTTINKLSNIGQRVKQLFVFTHNINFASEFWRNVNQLSLNKQCSKIVSIQNSSCLAEYDIENEVLTSIQKDAKKITEYIKNGVLSDQDRRSIARCLRPVLEGYFRIKFFDIVEANQWLGDFISKIRDASDDSSNKLSRLHPHIDEFTEINNYSKKYHHSSNTNSENEPINDAELKIYCKKTIDMIQLI